MAAPVLTLLEQKKALSGKKKKRVIKNVLGIPSNLKVETHTCKANEVENLCKILSRLLPSARLPVQQNVRFKKEKDKKEISLDKIHIENARNKRNQLSLGVNAVSKGIKNELISTVLIASDIQPKFLIHHLNMLCSHNKIPFLHMPGLREIMKNSLGFPCIALGFKKNFSDFSEAVEEIKLISRTQNIESKEDEQSLTESSKSDSEEVTDDEECAENEAKGVGTPFTYLYRTSTKTRVFVPESNISDTLLQKSDKDFLSILKDDSLTELKQNSPKGISSNSMKKLNKKKMLNVNSLYISELSDEESLEVPRKKFKKNWVIDKVGAKPKFKYKPANLIKIHSNPARLKKNK